MSYRVAISQSTDIGYLRCGSCFSGDVITSPIRVAPSPGRTGHNWPPSWQGGDNAKRSNDTEGLLGGGHDVDEETAL
jgi:hypothetical protein